MTASAKFLSVFSLIVLFAVAPASAGVLSASGSAFEGWSGTTPFSNASGLAGDVDWVVLTSSNFSASFPGAAYSPPSDELVYVYQIVNTGSVAISSFSLPVRNDASMIGHFEDVGAADVTGGGPNASSLTTDPISGRALWDFSTDAIGAGVNSLGLVFSSPNTPINIFSTVVDGGTKALDVPVPTPSDVQIPEPSTFILMMLGATLSLAPNARRRRDRE